MSDTHRHAWAAGFLDGDGCFCLAKYGTKVAETTRAVSVSAGNNNIAPLEELQSLFGGRVRCSHQTSAGNDHWQWMLVGAQPVREAITQLLPYLIDKKEVAEVVFAYAVLLKGRGIRPDDENIAMRCELIDHYAELRA